MKIAVNDHRKIYAVQQEFSGLFPYLKIRFLVKPSGSRGAHPERFVKGSVATLGECRSSHSSGNITIRPAMTVGELAEHFRDVYGLSIQVFRKSGNLWLETGSTEKLTLEEQNRQGEALCNRTKHSGKDQLAM